MYTVNILSIVKYYITDVNVEEHCSLSWVLQNHFLIMRFKFLKIHQITKLKTSPVSHNNIVYIFHSIGINMVNTYKCTCILSDNMNNLNTFMYNVHKYIVMYTPTPLQLLYVRWTYMFDSSVSELAVR